MMCKLSLPFRTCLLLDDGLWMESMTKTQRSQRQFSSNYHDSEVKTTELWTTQNSWFYRRVNQRKKLHLACRNSSFTSKYVLSPVVVFQLLLFTRRHTQCCHCLSQNKLQRSILYHLEAMLKPSNTVHWRD